MFFLQLVKQHIQVFLLFSKYNQLVYLEHYKLEYYNMTVNYHQSISKILIHVELN